MTQVKALVDDLMKALGFELAKFDPNQPREPAGTPEGSQFAGRQGELSKEVEEAAKLSRYGRVFRASSGKLYAGYDHMGYSVVGIRNGKLFGPIRGVGNMKQIAGPLQLPKVERLG